MGAAAILYCGAVGPVEDEVELLLVCGRLAEGGIPIYLLVRIAGDLYREDLGVGSGLLGALENRIRGRDEEDARAILDDWTLVSIADVDRYFVGVGDAEDPPEIVALLAGGVP